MSGLHTPNRIDTVQFKGNKVTIRHKDYWLAEKSSNTSRTTAMSAAAAHALGFTNKLGFGGVMDWHKDPYAGHYIEIYAMTDVDAPNHGPRRCFVLYDREITTSESHLKHFAANVVGYISIKNDRGYSTPYTLDVHRPNIFSITAIDNGAAKPFNYSARNAHYG